MTNAHMERLKADATGNTALSAVLAEAVDGFSSTEDAVRFLASRGFEVTSADLADAAADDLPPAAQEDAEPDGYGTLMRFLRRH
ncbi:hypothetical protein EZH22_19420 [Xanthobacter dioxanivorans]|uniref:Nif11 domain-containing protein n=1 Tax=Xanthobacter dioxanivorans TaxID=2528964 RepID=A0A974PLM3_9HYPH|nr:hypothetical protein [Xanthobacter dioxanivorans]QRG05255.1 hypothetical protein EZH22_19420 [Xanthobacter dioxanivorans]